MTTVQKQGGVIQRRQRIWEKKGNYSPPPRLLLLARQVWYALLHPLQLDILIPAIGDGDDVASWWL
jgi:hypothetical protein